MVENRPLSRYIAHMILILGVLIIFLPIWLAFVASTHSADRLVNEQMPFWLGSHLLENYSAVLDEGMKKAGGVPVRIMMVNSLIMALAIAIGKIFISFLSAFAIVYFRFPFRRTIFWMIFVTLMLPVEVRILPTFEIVANLGMFNSYGGLIIPLIASATATFLFRQFFMTVPDELLEAARMDGAGPMRFLKDILLPLSRTSIAALFVIQFIYGWNQFLWPLLVTTDQSLYTIVMGIRSMITVGDSEPAWHLIMATSILAMLPPVVVVMVMQRQFIKGLVETEK